MRLYYLPLLVLIYASGYSQKQGNNWLFGLQSGVTFNNGTLTSISGGQTGTDAGIGNVQEGITAVSDSSGNLLFYSGGKTVWNKNHVQMPNGGGLLGGTSSTQSSIIVPLPLSDSLFYLFTSDEFQSYTSPPNHGYRYSVVNMCLNNGQGDILSNQKNILLLDSCAEKLAACADSALTGYWILGHKMFSSSFYAWHLTPSGLSSPAITSLGKKHGWDTTHQSWSPGEAQGQMKFNSAGTKVALAVGNADPAIVELFNFNTNIGILSNLCHMVIDSILHKNAYGIEFSPDNTKLYVGVVGGAGGKRLYQYDLTAGSGNCDSIINSKHMIFQSNYNSVMLGMQLAPNNKIYLVADDYTHLSCINYPNLTGMSAVFDSSAITVSGTNTGMTLPSFVAGYKYDNKTPCLQNSVEQYALQDFLTACPNPTTGLINLKSAGQITYVYVYNLMGELVYENKGPLKDQQIDLTKEKNGIYFCKIKTTEGEKIFKIIKTD